MSYRFCISVIHLGRYKLEMLDQDYKIVWGADGGSAFIMVQLCKWLFEPEHQQYLKDQRASSDKIASEVIDDMRTNPAKYLPTSPVEALKVAEAGKSETSSTSKLIDVGAHEPYTADK